MPLATVSCELRRLETPVRGRWLLWKVLTCIDVTEHPVLTFTDGVHPHHLAADSLRKGHAGQMPDG